MKTKIEIRSLFAGVLLGAAAVLSIGAITGAGRAAWEYKMLSGNYPAALEKQINKAAAEGWEFVSASGGAPLWLIVLRREDPSRREDPWKAIQGK
ncbi:MAG: DUF4177 domain-containing protein [Opitutaceae bacterium]|jgi:hypothetical protein|nr:DUF4177 domain-containing protein [Opitutaceae bacterium]